MDLIDLDLVTAVAETGSITHGAARARLSLPSASGRIRSLEHTLGVTLFDRGRRGVALTPAGQVLLRHARSVCHAVGQLRTELDEYAQGHGATVRVQGPLANFLGHYHSAKARGQTETVNSPAITTAPAAPFLINWHAAPTGEIWALRRAAPLLDSAIAQSSGPRERQFP